MPIPALAKKARSLVIVFPLLVAVLTVLRGQPSLHAGQNSVRSTLSYLVYNPCDDGTLELNNDMQLACQPRLRALQPLRIAIPTASVYWSAVLHDKTSDVLVPVIRSFRNKNEGWTVAPRAGTYNLIIRTPQEAHTVEVDPEPYRCFAMLPSGGQRYLNLTTSVFPAAWQYCRAGEPAAPGFGTHSPKTLRPNESVALNRPFLFREPPHDTDAQRVVEIVTSGVYGDHVSAVARRGAGSVGYWSRRSSTNNTRGQLDYSTEPVGCPLSFDKALHQDRCNYEALAYAWYPVGALPSSRIRSAEETARCAEQKQVSVVGDSLGHALFRALNCVTGGYAAVKNALHAVRIVHHAPALMVLFTPLDSRLELTYEDFVQLLYASQDRTDFLWHFGMWMISYAPSSEWPRGLRRLAKYAKRHSKETGTTHWLSFVTAPFWSGFPAGGPGWQTATRAFEWNRLVLELAWRNNFTVIDLFGPTSARTDGRLDNCHYCDFLMYEMGHIAYSAICN